MKYHLIVVLSITALVGCSSNEDGIKDKNLSDTMSREALCVASSERLFLYAEAKRHLTHGRSAGSLRYDIYKKENNFHALVTEMRKIVADLPQEHSALYLSEQCDKNITNHDVKFAQ